MPRTKATAPAAIPTGETVTVEDSSVPTVEEAMPSRNYQLKKQFMQKVQGNKEHPTWKAVLDALHQMGLKSIETEIVMVPTPENGDTAIVKARITMEDSSFFEAVGLASASNVPNPNIAKHLLHMAETRAKGRAGRDAINVAEAILEEMADTPAPSNFSPVIKNPTQDAIDRLWASDDVERKNRVRQFIVDNLSSLGDNPPTIASVADVKALPESYLKRALEA